MALLLTGETDPSLNAMTQDAIRNLNLVSDAAEKSGASMQSLRQAFRASLAPVTEADALFENHIATQVMLQQNASRLSQVLDNEAEQFLMVGKAAQQSANGLGRVQTAAQQGVFALDDFVAGFQTGGVAGGIRGAANNLSFLAMQLGNIKVALGAIGALAVAQLAVKWWEESERKKIELAKKAVDEYRDSIQQTRDAIANSGSSSSEIRGIQKSTDLDALKEQQSELVAQGGDAFDQGGSLLALRNQLDTELQNLQFNSNRTAEQDMRLEALREEIKETDRLSQALGREDAERIKVIRAIEAQIKAVEEAEAARKRSRDADVEFEQFLSGSDRAGMDDERLRNEQEIADLQERIDAASGDMDVSSFSKLPSAFGMGSSGDVSAINQAIAGPMNLRDAADQQTAKNTAEIARWTKRQNELTERNRFIAEVVGL